MSWSGKVRIRRVDSTFFFERQTSPNTWELIKQTDLPFTDSAYPVVVSEGAVVNTLDQVTLRSES